MNTYKIINIKDSETETIYADSLTVNKRGQFIFEKDIEIIAVFSKKHIVFKEGSTESIYKEQVKKALTGIREQIDSVDPNFGNDIFLKDKNNELAYSQLRQILAIIANELNHTIDKL